VLKIIKTATRVERGLKAKSGFTIVYLFYEQAKEQKTSNTLKSSNRRMR